MAQQYCTRAHIHVDRVASAWLIKRFLDPNAEFLFLDQPLVPEGAIAFDMYGVDWGHHDNDCSFETILKRHPQLDDPVLHKIARIVHGADILTDADETLESPGLALVFRGLRLVSDSDEQTLERGCWIMDGLYAALSRK